MRRRQGWAERRNLLDRSILVRAAELAESPEAKALLERAIDELDEERWRDRSRCGE